MNNAQHQDEQHPQHENGMLPGIRLTLVRIIVERDADTCQRTDRHDERHPQVVRTAAPQTDQGENQSGGRDPFAHADGQDAAYPARD
ncbi:hypothetical protein LP420_12205 [Massilia sp. B-10]|nr:hypothetical protein LP420_12205 [Massilia sp. B-10]